MHLSSGINTQMDRHPWAPNDVKIYDYYLTENGFENSGNTCLPTPPRSPSHSEILDDIKDLSELLFTTSSADCLGYFSGFLDSDAVGGNSIISTSQGISPNLNVSSWPGKLCGGGAKLELKHDCMWSGRCVESCNQKSVSDSAVPWTELSPSITDLSPSIITDLFLDRSESPVSFGDQESPVAPLASPLLHLPPPVGGGDVSSPENSSPSRPVNSAAATEVELESSTASRPDVLPAYTPLSDHSYHQLVPPPEVLSSFVDLAEIGALRTNSSSRVNNGRNIAAITLNIGELLGANHRNIILSDTPSDSDDEIDVVTVPKSIILQKVKPIKISLPTNHQYQYPTTTIKQEILDIKPVITQSQKVKAKLGRRPKNFTVDNDNESRKITIKQEPEDTLKKTIKRERDDITTVSCGSWSSDNIFVQPSYENHRVKRRNLGSTNTSGQKQHKEPKKYRRFKKSRKYSSNGSSRSSSDSEDCEKRSQHNSMERKRRDDLRYAFQNLRENVPDLKDNPKAPKVMILNKAANYAKQLTNTGAALERTLKQENKRRLELQRKLQQLQRNN